jgi:hypothetical protein
VSPAPIADADAAVTLAALLDEWSQPWFDGGTLVALEAAESADRIGHFHWLLRFKGDEKEFVTLWLTLRQRTVFIEVQVMPAPEENVEAVYRFLLAKNAALHPLHAALGPEDAVYLVGRVPVGEVNLEVLDELAGAAVHYVDQIFPTAMELGMGSFYRRRRRN